MDIVSRYAAKPVRRAIGLWASGSGVDAALLQVAGAGASTQISLLRFRRLSYPAALREALLRATSPEYPGAEVCRLNFALGRIMAEAAKEVARAAGTALSEVDLIGCAGLTLYQTAPGEAALGQPCPASVLQIGETGVIAAETGVTTVGDFDVADVAAGGCGTALLPFADFVLFHHSTKTRAVQTIGKLASVTVVPAGDDPERVIAFDTGPGHQVVDSITEIVSEGKLLSDHDGRLASLGQVRQEVLEYMMAHSFIQQSPPKSASGGEFGAEFISGVLDAAQRHDITVEDLLATATAFTAESIARSYREFLAPEHQIDEVILGGGGSYNATLRRMLASRLGGVPIYLHEDFGIYGEAKRAIGYAILANEVMAGSRAPRPPGAGAPSVRPAGKIIPGLEA